MNKRPASSYPRPGATLVDQLFNRVGLAEKAKAFRAMHAWHRMAGARLGKHTRPERVRGRALYVRVATAPWANELSYMRAHLLEQLRATRGAEWIDELSFTIGPLDGLPDFSDPVDAAADAPPLPPRPPIDGGAVAGELLRVEDPELRGALAELFAHAQSTR